MKIYWRPRTVSRGVLIVIALIAMAGLLIVEVFKTKTRQPFHDQKTAAAALAREAMDVIKAERLRRGLPIDAETDPTRSGLMGPLLSPVTSSAAKLSAKQTAVNPNFAAVVVQLLRRAKVAEGDVVAVGCSGSFPGINACVYAAAQTLKVRPIIVASAASSQWGANDPEFLWLDMERLLHERRVFDFRVAAASVGGIDDRGLGMSPEGIALLKSGIERSGVEELQARHFTDSVNQRMDLYRRLARNRPIKAYVNVGGGTASVGTLVGKKLFRSGLNRRLPPGETIDSVMSRFVKNGVPVIHLERVEVLARRYGLPIPPTSPPQVGEGEIFYRSEYNRWLAGAALAAIVGCAYALIRSQWGYRVLRAGPRKPRRATIEPSI